jgi:hypothetical protein
MLAGAKFKVQSSKFKVQGGKYGHPSANPPCYLGGYEWPVHGEGTRTYLIGL